LERATSQGIGSEKKRNFDALITMHIQEEKAELQN
jgi:hypothetical protein